MVFNGVVKAADAVQPTYGLFSVAEVENHGSNNQNWIDGYFVESSLCGFSTQIIPICAPAEDWINVFDNSDGANFFRVSPFGIFESFECNNSIGINAVDRKATTINQLKTITEFAVERELWLGDNAQSVNDDDSDDYNNERYLTNAQDATPTPGTAVKAKLALGLLEQAFAEVNPGVQPTIHVTPLIAVALDELLIEDDGKLITKTGAVVAVSRGGLGEEGPGSGGSATKHWMYATGPVHVDLGGEELITVNNGDIVDAKTNKVRYVAERPAAVYFDGCAWFGVLADATL